MKFPVLTLSLSLSTLGLAVALPKEGADAIAHTAAENADADAAVYCGWGLKFCYGNGGCCPYDWFCCPDGCCPPGYPFCGIDGRCYTR